MLAANVQGAKARSIKVKHVMMYAGYARPVASSALHFLLSRSSGSASEKSADPILRFFACFASFLPLFLLLGLISWPVFNRPS